MRGGGCSITAIILHPPGESCCRKQTAIAGARGRCRSWAAIVPLAKRELKANLLSVESRAGGDRDNAAPLRCGL